MSASPGLIAYQLSFQVSPIILTGGVASAIPGGMLPIISITEAVNFVGGLLSGASPTSLDDFFASYRPLPGSTLIDNQIGNYPFANQAVAANAIIAQPLTLSMLMTCPVRQQGGYATKLATMIALKATLTQHAASGGTYTVATPVCYYDNLILLRVTDVSGDQSKQAQMAFRWDFVQPLLTLAAADAAQNSMMSKLTAGTQTDGSLSGTAPTIGSPPSLATMSVAPAAQNAAGAGIAPSFGGF